MGLQAVGLDWTLPEPSNYLKHSFLSKLRLKILPHYSIGILNLESFLDNF